jgi:hypothetical protein
VTARLVGPRVPAAGWMAGSTATWTLGHCGVGPSLKPFQDLLGVDDAPSAKC